MRQWDHLMGAELVDGPATGRLINCSVSENTRRVYTSQLRRLDVWLEGRPLNDATLAEYVGWLYESGVASATPTQAIAACRFEARMAGAGDPCGALTTRALAGFRRDADAQQRGRGQAFGISARQAARMAALAAEDGTSIRGLRDAAIIAVMSDAMLRVSEAADLRAEAPGDGVGDRGWRPPGSAASVATLPAPRNRAPSKNPHPPKRGHL